ncbi:hypothetical protein [Candidatus Poriferisodalis sp.]|uniref:hypothetical protein n=1 Tax=Candidatus Poriferisodalis sp. TaxID=3101277 RepID=UPI003B0190D6
MTFDWILRKEASDALPAARGATGELSYSMAWPLPTGKVLEVIEGVPTITGAATELAPERTYRMIATDAVGSVFHEFRASVSAPLALRAPARIAVGETTDLPEPTGGPRPAQRWLTNQSGAEVVDEWSLKPATAGEVTATAHVRSGSLSLDQAISLEADWLLRSAWHLDPAPVQQFAEDDFMSSRGTVAVGDTIQLGHFDYRGGEVDIAIASPVAAGPVTGIYALGARDPSRNTLRVWTAYDIEIDGKAYHVFELRHPSDAPTPASGSSFRFRH